MVLRTRKVHNWTGNVNIWGVCAADEVLLITRGAFHMLRSFRPMIPRTSNPGFRFETLELPKLLTEFQVSEYSKLVVAVSGILSP